MEVMKRKLLTVISEIILTYQDHGMVVDSLGIPEWMLEVLDAELIMDRSTPEWLEHGFKRDDAGKIVPPTILFGLPVVVVDDDLYVKVFSDPEAIEYARARRKALIEDMNKWGKMSV